MYLETRQALFIELRADQCDRNTRLRRIRREHFQNGTVLTLLTSPQAPLRGVEGPLRIVPCATHQEARPRTVGRQRRVARRQSMVCGGCSGARERVLTVLTGRRVHKFKWMCQYEPHGTPQRPESISSWPHTIAPWFVTSIAGTRPDRSNSMCKRPRRLRRLFYCSTMKSRR